ncbi:MAG: pyridoxal 5'-phosphate synthase glutaminase subunit PdxT [Planctomycetes bacterium]|nr:pyridoxal 5'-phosphate synthase glutaminase subunit PdxT [Planctomycetota bacterium]
MTAAVQVGVLALQGSFEPHARAVRRLGHEPVLVRARADLGGLTHLILPGGESTTLHHLLVLFGLFDEIRERAARGELALFGTCAGAILMGQDDGTRPPRFGLIDATLARNAYGRQVDSFEAELAPGEFGAAPLRAIFIRAPCLTGVGPQVRVLARHRGEPVLVEQGPHLAATFHPELAGEDRILARFLGLGEGRRVGPAASQHAAPAAGAKPKLRPRA